MMKDKTGKYSIHVNGYRVESENRAKSWRGVDKTPFLYPIRTKSVRMGAPGPCGHLPLFRRQEKTPLMRVNLACAASVRC